MVVFKNATEMYEALIDQGLSEETAAKKVSSAMGQSLSKHPNFRLIYAIVQDLLKMAESPDIDGHVFSEKHNTDAAFLGTYLGKYGGVDAMRFAAVTLKSHYPHTEWDQELAQAFDGICGFDP